MHVLVFLAKGHLPWMGLQGDGRKEKYERIREAKVTTPISVVCRDLPEQFEELLTYCRTMEYEQEPDYTAMKELLRLAWRTLPRSEVELD